MLWLLSSSIWSDLVSCAILRVYSLSFPWRGFIGTECKSSSLICFTRVVWVGHKDFYGYSVFKNILLHEFADIVENIKHRQFFIVSQYVGCIDKNINISETRYTIRYPISNKICNIKNRYTDSIFMYIFL